MKRPNRLNYMILTAIVYGIINTAFAQVISNKNFSLGSYGRIGAGFAPQINGGIGRSMNLNGMGSIGGRMEEADYLELLTAFHYNANEKKADSTLINVQVRMAFYSSSGQMIGNVTSKSAYGGITAALPELYAEARHILGTPWNIWIGAKKFRGDDIHIADHYFFDDHSTQGIGASYKNSSFGILFPGAVDSSSSVPPYFYLNIVDGTPRIGLRGRTVVVFEQNFPFKDKQQSIKLLTEFHKLGDATVADTSTKYNYPSDIGWVIGAKHVINIKTEKPGSFNQFAVRYGSGIANGDDGGNSLTWLTYGAPNMNSKKFTGAYCFSLVEHLMLNLSNKFSINAYGIYTKNKGGSDSTNKSPDYFGRELFNNKTDLALGARAFFYITDHFVLMSELHHAIRKDGDQDPAAMTKFSIVPTYVPSGKRDPWARPQFRFIYSIAHYNQFASDHMYSPFLQEVGKKTWGQYFAVRVEWWIY